MRERGKVICLSVSDSGELPSEFRIFRAGENTSTKGDRVFDEKAAAMVMAAYEKHGADLPLDLEHLSINPEARHFNSDAMAWFKLELRDGELWAVDVKWTDEGARRLKAKSQRYISPAFFSEKKSRRITELLNVALTSLPATDGLDALIAASRHAERRSDMADETMDEAKVLEGLGIDGDALKKALGLEAGATLEDLAAAMMASADKLGSIAGLAPAPKEEPAAEGEAATTAPDEEQKEMQAARATLFRETGATTLLQALSSVADWKASHLKLESEKAKLAKERAALEAAERRSIGAALVNGGMPPALVWADDDAKTLAPALQGQPIEKLRAYAAKAGKQPETRAGATAPTTATDHGLSKRELEMCRANKVDPAKYAETKSRLAARSGRVAPVEG